MESGTTSRESKRKKTKQHCFPAFEKKINDAIETLGVRCLLKRGGVLRKMQSGLVAHWNAQTPGEVYLLLKSSDFVSYDLAHAYDLVQDIW